MDDVILARAPFLCIAFDLEAVDALPIPCMSVCVDSDYFARRIGLDVPQSAEELQELSRACHVALHGHDFQPEPLAQLQRLLGNVGDIEVKHVSFMLSRTPAVAKVDVRLEVARLADLLDRLEWRPGSSMAVQRAVRELLPEQQHIQLNLPLTPGFGSVLEAEFLAGQSQVSREARLAFLDRLVGAGLCAPAKAEVLAKAALEPLAPQNDGSTVARAWYVKVRFDGGMPSEAKAYLGLMPHRPAARRPD
ncbi:MAG TPA: hypothetical protein VJV78_23640 [Polyangiales bacterium]|nr:hypothetical protein [Polyangiales bacterium]